MFVSLRVEYAWVWGPILAVDAENLQKEKRNKWLII